jgi:hypothetical protein
MARTPWVRRPGGDLALEVIEGDDEHAAARLVELASHVLRVVEASNSEGTCYGCSISATCLLTCQGCEASAAVYVGPCSL